jgi:hypothetical protein
MYARVGSKPYLQILDLREKHSSLFVHSLSIEDEEISLIGSTPQQLKHLSNQGRLSTVELLVLTGSDQHLLNLKMFLPLLQNKLP